MAVSEGTFLAPGLTARHDRMLQYDCPEPGCAFCVRAATEYEVFDAVETHAQDRHGVWLSGRAMREDVREV